jgi:hypothetical protein
MARLLLCARFGGRARRGGEPAEESIDDHAQPEQVLQ